MMRLTETIGAWGTPDFAATLSGELERLGGEQLPLQQGLSASSYALADKVKVLVNRVAERESVILVEAGIFYTGIIPGCSCADDPTPIDEVTEYCEIRLQIDKTTGDTVLALV